MLTPKIGKGERLICGPNLVTNLVQRGGISLEDSAEMLAIGSLFALISWDRMVTWPERKEGANG
jgi:hypothetical protein